MDVKDNVEFRKRLIALGELLDASLSPTKQALYFEALRDLAFEDVIGALNAAAKACTFMPRPADLRKLAVGDSEDHAEQAWMLFRSAMRSAGAYASIATTDPALGETILAVFQSWPAACRLDLSAEMWANRRKEFGRVYRVLRDRNLTGVRYLVGLTEEQNAGREDWTKYVTVAVLEGSDVLRLIGEDAVKYRARIAAASHAETRELSRLTEGVSLPARLKAPA